MNETLLNTMFAGIQNNSLHQDLYILRDNLREIKECVYFYKTKISKEKTGIEKTNIILVIVYHYGGLYMLLKKCRIMQTFREINN